MSRQILLVALLGLSAMLIIVGCQGPQERTGITSRFAPCPDSSNCVSTFAADEAHAMAPLTFAGPAGETKARLLKVIRQMPRAEIVEDDAAYVRATFTSRIFRFVDDVEFQIDENEGLIHFRSSSRIGRADMGVNRSRMEAIREAFDATR